MRVSVLNAYFGQGFTLFYRQVGLNQTQGVYLGGHPDPDTILAKVGSPQEHSYSLI